MSSNHVRFSSGFVQLYKWSFSLEKKQNIILNLWRILLLVCSSCTVFSLFLLSCTLLWLLRYFLGLLIASLSWFLSLSSFQNYFFFFTSLYPPSFLKSLTTLFYFIFNIYKFNLAYISNLSDNFYQQPTFFSWAGLSRNRQTVLRKFTTSNSPNFIIQ